MYRYGSRTDSPPCRDEPVASRTVDAMDFTSVAAPGALIVVTAAGRSQRFAEHGVSGPKWALPLGDQTMLERAIRSLEPIIQGDSQLRLVVTEDQLPYLKRISGSLPPFTISIADRPIPPGQALDTMHAIGDADHDAPLVVWNADTILESSVFAAGVPDGAWLLLSEQPGEHWSFAALDGDRVTSTAEKCRISSWASAGLYAFATVQQFRDAVDAELATHAPGTEMYIAPLYNRLIAHGHPVRALKAPSTSVTCVGTPAEYRSACLSSRWSIPGDLR